ncbi:hypothetical protein [Phascolarctobacterium faecium]|uniref:hypothetical protein n=1 Tax=Phascolarctobacterium faecium TaxID=33025 RepID=UPI003FD73D67
MELYEALETIKNECAKRAECVDCPFALGHSYCGIITNGFSGNWNLQKPVNKLFTVETMHVKER